MNSIKVMLFVYLVIISFVRAETDLESDIQPSESDPWYLEPPYIYALGFVGICCLIAVITLIFVLKGLSDDGYFEDLSKKEKKREKVRPHRVEPYKPKDLLASMENINNNQHRKWSAFDPRLNEIPEQPIQDDNMTEIDLNSEQVNTEQVNSERIVIRI